MDVVVIPALGTLYRVVRLPKSTRLKLNTLRRIIGGFNIASQTYFDEEISPFSMIYNADACFEDECTNPIGATVLKELRLAAPDACAGTIVIAHSNLQCSLTTEQIHFIISLCQRAWRET